MNSISNESYCFDWLLLLLLLLLLLSLLLK
jgi:hypothetical protein